MKSVDFKIAKDSKEELFVLDSLDKCNLAYEVREFTQESHLIRIDISSSEEEASLNNIIPALPCLEEFTPQDKMQLILLHRKMTSDDSLIGSRAKNKVYNGMVNTVKK